MLTDVLPLAPAAPVPLLAGLDLHALLVQKARHVTPPDWLDPVLSTAGGPLLLTGAHTFNIDVAAELPFSHSHACSAGDHIGNAQRRFRGLRVGGRFE